jgi:hypothetical protein
MVSGGEAEVLKEGLKDIRYFYLFVFCRSRLRKGESKQISSLLLKPHARVFPCNLVKPEPTWIRVHDTA